MKRRREQPSQQEHLNNDKTLLPDRRIAAGRPERPTPLLIAGRNGPGVVGAPLAAPLFSVITLYCIQKGGSVPRFKKEQGGWDAPAKNTLPQQQLPSGRGISIRRDDKDFGKF